MKIGVVSDSHSDVAAARKAGRIFARENVGAVFHAGDIGSLDVLEELARQLPEGTPIYAVMGNMDPAALRLAPTPEDVYIRQHAFHIELNGKIIVLMHGDRELELLDTWRRHAVDFLFSGHTHRAQVLHHGKTHWINPGAIHRATEPSVAIVELETGEATMVPLDG